MYRKFMATALAISTFTFASPGLADCYASKGCWGALAQAMWNDSRGRAHVSVGSVVNAASEGDAHRSAKSSCQENTAGQICTVVGTFRGGNCGYITSGVHNGNGTVRWATGSTAESTYNQCSSGGFVCDWPIGGCTSAPE